MIHELLLSYVAMFTSVASEIPRHTASLECYPKVITPGDSIYMSITVNNPHEESILIPHIFWLHHSGPGTVQVEIVEWEMPLLCTMSVDAGTILDDGDVGFRELKPGESREIDSRSWEIPPLELLHDAKYEEFMNDLPPEGREITLRVRVNSCTIKQEVWYGTEEGSHEDFTITLEQKLTIKPRNTKETALIESWYDETPKKWFPYMDPDGSSLVKVVDWPRYLDGDAPSWKGIDWPYPAADPLFYVGYPGSLYASKMPKDWKALEASLAPSTMRDEIQLRRMISERENATTDAAKQAKQREIIKWLLSLPKIQREIMAHNFGIDLSQTFPPKNAAGHFDLYRRLLGWKSMPVAPPEPPKPSDRFYIVEAGCVYNAGAQKGQVFNG